MSIASPSAPRVLPGAAKLVGFLASIAPLALLISVAQAARPVVLENSATFTTPDPNFHYFARHVAVDGDNALALGEFFDPATGNDAVQRGVFWFQRQSTGTWVFKRKLIDSYFQGTTVSPALAFKGGVAAAITDKLHVWELIAGDLVESVVDPAVANDVNGPELAIDAGRILGSNPAHCSWDGAMFTKVSGVWTVTTRFPGPSFDCVYAQPGAPVALAGPRTLLSWPYANNQTQPLAGLFYGSNFQQSLGGPGRFGPSLSIDNNGVTYHVSDPQNAVVTEWYGAEDYVGWVNYTPLGAAMDGAPNTVHANDELILDQVWSSERGAWVINVFARNNTGYDPPTLTARLVAPKGATLGTHFDVSGRRVVASGNNGYNGSNTAYVFDVPASFTTTPATLQDDFQSGSAAGWSTLAGSQFAVAQLGRTTVYRQSDTAGSAGALFSGSDRTAQGVQAEVRPLAFAATDSWVGVMSRYQSESNYYFATLGRSSVELRKLANGTNTLLASAPFSATAGKAYRLQLVSVGNLHQAYVDGRKVVQVYNNGLTHGRSGVRTWKTSAEFDNFVLTGGEHTTIYRTAFDEGAAQPAGLYANGTWQSGSVRAGQFSQRSLDPAREAIQIMPAATDDQVVSAKITLDAYGTPASGQQSWYGLMVRHNDYGYYALAILPNNQLQLRRVLRSGANLQVKTTRVLATATVSSGPHEFRLEAIGDRLRSYVDGNPLREVQESQFPSGAAGMATYATQASFDDFLAYQP